MPDNTECMGSAFKEAKRVTDYLKYQSADFRNEKQLTDYINLHPVDFAKDILEIEYSGHQREYCISHDRRINSGWKARVDFMFKSELGDIYVECKNPIHIYSEANQALSQILSYSCIADFYGRKVNRLVLLTTKYNAILGATIRKFNLPIEVFVFSKNRVLKLMEHV